MAFNNIYKLVFFIICVKVFCNINYFCFICRFDLYQSSPSFFPLACLCQLFGDAFLYIVSIFLVFLLIFFISSFLQLIIPKLILNTGTASAPIAVTVFLFQSFFHLLTLYAFTFLNPEVFASFYLF